MKNRCFGNANQTCRQTKMPKSIPGTKMIAIADLPKMSMSNTMSTRGAPKIVIAQYECPERAWRIPFGLDLDDKNVVKDWWIKWEYLHIEYTDGRKESFESIWESEGDQKYPLDYRIDDADELGIDFDEEIEKFLANLEDQKPKVFFKIQIERLKRNPLVNLGFFMRLDMMRCFA